MIFRLNYNIDAMDIFSDRQKEQYFEPFLNLSAGFSFVDIGGFDGYTTKQFIEVCPNYNNIWFFEPEEHNLVVAKELLKEHPQITYCQVAASDKVTELRFEPSNDASKITENGSVTVKAQLIDNIIPQDSKNLFIKMDIEGAESQAIAGAVKTIRNCHPTMAISVYHKGADFIDIPKQIFSIRDDYNIYLRHYTEGISETIMFFVPKG